MKLRDRARGYGQLHLDLCPHRSPQTVIAVDSIDPPLSPSDMASLDKLITALNASTTSSFTGHRFCHRGSMVTLTRLRVR